MPKKAAPRKKEGYPGPWWLGTLIVYVCMLSTMLLVGLLSSSLGFASATGSMEVLVDDNVVASAVNAGGWDWLEVNTNVPGWSGQHNITIRWITIDGTLGAVHFDNLRLGDNLLEGFETDPTTSMNGWIYSENDTNNTISVQRQSERTASGAYGWAFTAPSNTGSGNSVQITKSFEFTGSENLRLWTWASWDMREFSDVISHIATYSVALIIVFLHVTRFERKKFWPSVGVRREGMMSSVVWVFALSVIFTGILYIYWGVVSAVMGSDPQQAIRGFFAPGPDWYFIYLSFAFFFPVAFTEELVFRGFTLERFSAKGAVKGVILGSFLFSSLHLWYASFGGAALPLYGGLFLVALWWGIVYMKTRNIFGLILFHGLFNLGTAVEHFWVWGRVILESSMFIIGVSCLGYLTFKYLRGLFAEMEALVKR
ncbi:MAG: type II CAAX endopeptidase family protein [Candidatus Hadarchaeota archaeon]